MPRSAAYIIVLLAFVKLVGGLLDSDHFGEFMLRGIFLAGAVWLMTKAFGVLEKLGNLASQQTELMVDAYAAQVCGWETHLNALLLVGERAETLKRFLEELHKVANRLEDELDSKAVLRILNRLPTKEIESADMGDTAVAFYIIERLTRLQKKLALPLGDEEINVLAAQAAKNLHKRQPGKDLSEDSEDELTDKERKDLEEAARKEEKEQKKKEEELCKKLVEWRSYDCDRSGQPRHPGIAPAGYRSAERSGSDDLPGVSGTGWAVARSPDHAPPHPVPGRPVRTVGKGIRQTEQAVATLLPSRPLGEGLGVRGLLAATDFFAWSSGQPLTPNPSPQRARGEKCGHRLLRCALRAQLRLSCLFQIKSSRRLLTLARLHSEQTPRMTKVWLAALKPCCRLTSLTSASMAGLWNSIILPH